MSTKLSRAVVGGTYRRLIKPILFLIHPDRVHHGMTVASRGLSRAPWTTKPLKWMMDYRHASIRQDVLGLFVANPIGISAGLDKNGDMLTVAKAIGCGFTTVGSVTLEPRTGNPHPWFYRLKRTKSLVVHAGMANQGLAVIAGRIKRRPKQLPLIVSVAVVANQANASEADMISDAIGAVRKIADDHLGDIIEINISCPNVQDDEPFTHPAALETLLTEVDKLGISQPVILKMPNSKEWGRYEAMLDVILKHTVKGVVISNLVRERDRVDPADKLTDDIKGAISGEPTRLRSLDLIRQTYQYCGGKLVIIGVGGVSSAQDAYDKIRAGANLVGLITGLIFEGPQLVGEINAGLVELLKRDGFKTIHDAVGADHGPKHLK